MRKSKQQFNSRSSAPAVRRGEKTLGWFLTEELLEKTGSPSPPISLKDKDNDRDKKRTRRGGRRARKLTESHSTASEASLTLDPEDEKKSEPSDFYVYDVASDGYYYEQNGAKGWRRRLPNGTNQQQQPQPAGGTTPPMQNGHAAGAQKRPTSTEAQQQQQAALHQAVMQEFALQQQQQGVFNGGMMYGPNAYNRYYDACSDGYFFEMASVDGWRKRTTPATTNNGPMPPFRAAGVPVAQQRRGVPGAPNGVVGSAPALGGGYAAYLEAQAAAAAAAAAAQMHHHHVQPRTSYGAALARGEMPAKYVIESSASSSVSEDNSYPSLTRPTSLDLPTSLNGAAAAEAGNREKFIEELVSRFDETSLLDLTTPRTPANSAWAPRFARRFEDYASAAAACSSAAPATTISEEKAAEVAHDEQYIIHQDLQMIWDNVRQ